jgi:hypothetical protein
MSPWQREKGVILRLLLIHVFGSTRTKIVGTFGPVLIVSLVNSVFSRTAFAATRLPNKLSQRLELLGGRPTQTAEGKERNSAKIHANQHATTVPG